MRSFRKGVIMKKLILAGTAAVAMLAGMPVAMADAECQAGSAWGAKPGCDSAGANPYVVPNTVYNNSGGPTVYSYPYALGAVPLALAQMQNITLPDGRLALLDPRTGQIVNNGTWNDRDGDGVRDSRDTDRDGDGVKNYRDRWPDDPRFR
jgi:hypothetical protein